MEDGWAAGVSVSPMPHSSCSRVCLLLERHTRRANIPRKDVNSCSNTNGKTAVGARAGRYVYFSSHLACNTLLIFRFQSCANLEWVEKEEAQVVQTAWAVMGLMYAKYPHPEPIERAVKLVMSRQLPVRSSQPSILCSGAHAHVFVPVTGRFVGTRSD